MRRSIVFLTSMLLAAALPAVSQDAITVEGRVTYEPKPPDREFLIELQTQQRRVVQTARVFGENDFRFVGITSGAYYIHIEVEGYEEVQQAFEVRGPTFVPVVLREKARRSETGRGDFVGDNPNVVDIRALAADHPKEAVDEYEKSLEDVRKGDTKRAIRRLEKALELAPDFYQAMNNLGLQYQKEKRFEDAEAQFRRAHALNRNEALPLINIGNLWIEQNAFQPAAVVLREAVRLDPRSAAASYYLGSALYKTGVFDEAETALRRALELDPGSPKVRLMLVNALVALEKHGEAVEQLDAYIEENPRGPEREAVEELRRKLTGPRR